MNITIENITKKFGKRKSKFVWNNTLPLNVNKETGQVIALNHVKMSFDSGKITGLIGFNGSGKTTTFSIITDLIENYDGKILFNGMPLDETTRKSFSFLVAGFEPYNMDTVWMHLKYIGYLYHLKKDVIFKKCTKLLKEVDFQANMNSKIKSLSKGNHQKVKLVAALLNPQLKILLLDEPFDGLDPLAVNNISKIIRNLTPAITIIITSHRMDVVDALCSSFYILKDGNVVKHYDKDAKKNNDDNIQVTVSSSSSSLLFLEHLPYVQKIKQVDNFWLINLDKIENFKMLSQELLNDPGYIYHTLKKMSVSQSFFEEYSQNENQ